MAAVVDDLESSYVTTTWLFAAALAVMLLFDVRQRSSAGLSCSSGLELLYLPAYTLSAMADWLQGPYVYALYSALGYGRTEINVLFVVGFGTSAIAGPFIGQLADQFGRKRMTLYLYCGAYACACVTKHVDNFWALLFGRVCGGVATSVLFSCFESWLVAEHTRRELSEAVLQHVLTYQYFINGLTGCLTGIVAQMAVDSMPITPVTSTSIVYVGGETLPFDMSATCLLLASLFICYMWQDQVWYKNASKSDAEAAVTSSTETTTAGANVTIREALRRTLNDPKLLTIMAVASCVESAMYAFIIEWTPALSAAGQSPPHGLVFSSFMISYMGGSTISGLLSRYMHPVTALLGFTSLGFLSMGLVFCLFHTGGALTSGGSFSVFLLFCAFELSIGGYMAVIATLKAEYVPDGIRATVYNIFRVPLNLIVVVINVVSLSSEFTFLACTCLLLIALLLAATFRANTRSRHARRHQRLVDKASETSSIAMDDSDAAADPSKAPGGL